MFSLKLKNLSKLFIVTVFLSIMILSISNNANAVCPPDFHPGGSVEQQVNPTCKIIIDYCISNNPGGLGTFEVYISEVTYIGNCIDYLLYPPSFFPVDWEYVLATIILENEALYQIGLCPGEIQVRMYNGGCFRHIQGFKVDENGEIYWCDYFEPCDMEGLASCRQYFTACIQFTQGQYVVKVTAGDVQTLFSCVDPENECQRLCE